MSDITVNSAQRQPTVTDTTSPTARAQSQANSASTSASSSTSSSSSGDQVTLSPAAAQIAAAGFTTTNLDDASAVSTSVGLRQSIGNSSNLSVSAKQNQAILSLLR